jgi:hypothetical protein
VIARPHGPAVTIIQRDDFRADQLPCLASVLLILETSRGSFRAWVAMSGAQRKDFARRLKTGTNADPNASGATRIAGSLNFQMKRFARLSNRQHRNC